MLKTIKDVATLAGVSIKTVSRVLNKEPHVSEQTINKVESAIAVLNYRPNTSARNLASRRSYVIALVYDDPDLHQKPSSNYLINLQQGALRICKSEHYDLLIHPVDYQSEHLYQEVDSLTMHSRVDGLILAPPLSDDRELIEQIKITQIPFVRISPGDDLEPEKSVKTNDRRICSQMMDYLISLGHRRIAFIKGHPDHKALDSRYQGYLDGLKKAGLRNRPSLIKQGDNSFASGQVCAKQLFQRKQPPTAIFACTDDMAAGVIRCAYQIGVKVPDQVSVVGFDDIPIADQIYPALTTIKQPVRSMADRAVEILMDQVRKRPAKNRPNLIESRLKIRESSAQLLL